MKLQGNMRYYSMLFLRICTAIILIIHGAGGMFNGGINDFGAYLNTQGFAPVGLLIAWAIKLSHLLAAIGIIARKWLLWLCPLTILILVTGIFMVHLPNGWFVVGGGFNGIEFNLLLIFVLLAIMFEKEQ